MPLLRAEQRPSMQQILENWSNPIEAGPEPADPLSTHLLSAPASGGVVAKFFG